eukprot:comp25303_c0_seq1/m.46985 comp25303_c0_seq1/g.46985  ORF comp25303_c0_seq1/g.46985 comp25303_c0_seq1/m.46985 type:complete len:135 (-) comp25303_c0_seq1:483-887(-)
MASRVREVTAEEAARIEAEEAKKREQLEDVDSDSDDEEVDESLLDRIVAIKEFIPESTRNGVTKAATWTHGTASAGLKFVGKASWVITTTLLLLGLPLLLAVESEQAIEEMEKEQQKQRQALNPGLYGMPMGPK